MNRYIKAKKKRNRQKRELRIVAKRGNFEIVEIELTCADTMNRNRRVYPSHIIEKTNYLLNNAIGNYYSGICNHTEDLLSETLKKYIKEGTDFDPYISQSSMINISSRSKKSMTQTQEYQRHLEINI